MTSLLSPSRNLLQHEPRGEGDTSLYRSLKKLPRRAQKVFLCSRLDDMPFPTIAQRLGISMECVEKDMLLVLEHCRPMNLQGDPHLLHDAGAWYVKLQCPSTTPSERIDFRRWLDADSVHLAAFHDTELAWRRLLAPARLLGVGQWYRRHRLSLSLRGWIVAVLTGGLLWELCSWI